MAQRCSRLEQISKLMAQRCSCWRGGGLLRTKKEILDVPVANTIEAQDLCQVNVPKLLITHSVILTKSIIELYLTSTCFLHSGIPFSACFSLITYHQKMLFNYECEAIMLVVKKGDVCPFCAKNKSLRRLMDC